MKPARLLLALCLFCPFLLHAQNWKTVLSGDTTYFYAGAHYAYPPPTSFQTTGNILKGIWVTGSQVTGSDTLFTFYPTVRDTTEYWQPAAIASKCMDTSGATWLGSRFIRKPDGTELYFNSFRDTVTIRTGAPLGSNWILARDTAGVVFTGTVAAAGVSTVDGVTDSVKTITISASLNGSQVSHWYTSQSLQLSKQHGWLRALDLYRFPNKVRNRDQVGVTIDSGGHRRLPAMVATADFQQVDLQWKYAPGNAWILSDIRGVSPSLGANQLITYDSVISSSLLAPDKIAVQLYSVSYDIKWQFVSGPTSSWQSFQTHTTWLHTDTISSGSMSPFVIRQRVFPEYKVSVMGPKIFDRYFIRPFCGDRYVLQYNSQLVGMHLDHDTSCWSLRPGVSGYSIARTDRLPGFGTVCSVYEDGLLFGSPGTYIRQEYTYLKLGNCVSGTWVDVHMLRVKDPHPEIHYNVYPNPSTDVLYISGLRPGMKTEVSLYDLTGRLLLRQTGNSEELTLPVHSFQAGLYLLAIKTERGTQAIKINIVR